MHDIIRLTIVRLGAIVLIFLSWLLSPVFWLTSLKKTKKITPIRDPLLRVSATTLARKIRQKEIKSEDLVRIYIKRIQEVNTVLNAVVQDRFSDALKDAEATDRFLSETTLNEQELSEQKPLLGVPITIKESCKVKGLSYAVGCRTRLGFIAEDDGETVKKLKKAGAIPLLVSNTPEMCFGYETDNLITGRTCNPYNPHCSSAGSSGGEGALIGAGASVIGIGSDLGGSIRLPSMFNGIFGHKPTAQLTPIVGHYPMCMDKNFYNYLVIGPMSRYAEDLKLVMKVISKSGVDLNEKIDVKDLTIYFMEDLGHSFYVPRIDGEIKQALFACIRHLRDNCGSTISNVKFEEFSSSFEVSSAMVFDVEDRPDMFVNQNDPTIRYNFWSEAFKRPFLKSTVDYNSLIYQILHRTNEVITTPKNPHYLKIESDMKEKLINQLGDRGVLLYPTYHSSAFRHRQTLFNIFGIGYMMIFNVLGFPSTHVPTGLDRKGLPIGIQVVAAPNRDALCLAVAEELERRFGGWVPPF